MSLESDGYSDSLERLSQSGAVTDILPNLAQNLSRSWKKLGVYIGIRSSPLTEEPYSASDCPVISTLFGVAAVFNIVFFVVLSAVVPWLIAEGVLGAPLVKSKWGSHCLRVNEPFPGPVPGDLEFTVYSKTEATFELCQNQLCQNQLDEGCQSKFFIQQPRIIKTRPSECLFSGGICNNKKKPLEMTHWNIAALELGLNSKSRITMNHRFTWSPVHLDPFLNVDAQQPNSVHISALDGEYVGERPPYDNMPLNSMNGPNSFSNKN